MDSPAWNGDDSGETMASPAWNGDDSGETMASPAWNGDDSGETMASPAWNGDDSGETMDSPAWNGDDSGETMEAPVTSLSDDGATSESTCEPSTKLLDSADIMNLAAEGRSYGKIGNYEIRGVLGKGASSIVYHAIGPEGRDVALKVFADESSMSTLGLKRFLREARLLGQLQELPGIVTVYDAGQTSEFFYIAMQMIPEGRTVSRLLDEQGRLPVIEAVHIAVRVAEALADVHRRGFIHRDVKPGNILITPEGDPFLTDFGLVQVFDSNLTLAGTILGTVEYMSPEIFEFGSNDAHATSDIYSLGVVLYKMITGVLPFDVEGDIPLGDVLDRLQGKPRDPGGFGIDIGRDLRAVILKMLERDPADRYATSDEVVAELRACLAGTKVKARIPSFGVFFERWTLRHKGVAISLIGGMAILLLVCVGYLDAQNRQRNRGLAAAIERIADQGLDANELFTLSKVENSESLELWRKCLKLLNKRQLAAAEVQVMKTYEWAKHNGNSELISRSLALVARFNMVHGESEKAQHQFLLLLEMSDLSLLEQELYCFEAGVAAGLADDRSAELASWRRLQARLEQAVKDDHPGSYLEVIAAYLLGNADELQLRHAMEKVPETFQSLGHWAMAKKTGEEEKRKRRMKLADAAGGHFFLWLTLGSDGPDNLQQMQ